MNKKVLLITDNDPLLNRFIDLIKSMEFEGKSDFSFDYAFSPNSKDLVEKYKDASWIKPLWVKHNVDGLVNDYYMIISLHCKQIFPPELVNNTRCINVHPGLNPNNRGWYPQVFSIINGLPAGATIHEIDEELDHGLTICQKEVKIESWDTSFTAYNKILDTEIELLNNHLESILKLDYETKKEEEGNLNLKKDFNDLCELDLDEVDTFKNHINKLRALTHGAYSNAHFFDEKGNKVYLKLELIKA